MMKELNNDRGSMLIENIIAMTIISIIGMIVLVTMTGGMNIYIKGQSVHKEVDEAYQKMESRVGTDVMPGEVETVGNLEFHYDGEAIEIPGKYYSDVDTKLGEFISD